MARAPFRLAVLHPAVIAPLLCLLYALVIAWAVGSVMIWVTPSSRMAPPEIQAGYTYSDWGYDGFYVYLMAAYPPDEAARYIDAPPYRYQRVLLPVAARTLALGQRAALPYTLLLINLAALGVGVWVLGRYLRAAGWSVWLTAGWAFSLAAFGSTRLSMTEPLAYGLVLLGILAVDRERWLAAALLFALAALTKETTLFFPAAYGFAWLMQGHWRRAFGFGLVVLTPFVLWQVGIYALFGEWGAGSGGSTDTGFEWVPFGAFWEMLRLSGPNGALMWSVLLGPTVILPTLWAFWRAAVDLRRGTFRMDTGLLLANALIIPFTPFSTFAEPIAIFRFIAGLQIALILYAAGRQMPRPLRYSTLWFFTGLLAVSSDLLLLTMVEA